MKKGLDKRVCEIQSVSRQERHIEWVDTAKAIGVILVITGHLLYRTHYGLINQLIYSFHMPMFFVLSGYVFEIHEEENMITFVRKKAKRLLLPAFIFIVITLPLYFWINRNKMTSFMSFCKLLFFVTGRIPYNDPCWFFVVLFEIYIIAYFLYSRFISIRYKVILCLLSFSIIAFMYCLNISKYLLFGLDKAVLGYGFFVLGSVFREVGLLECKNLLMKTIMFAVSCMGLIMFGIFLNNKVSMYYFSLDNITFFLVSGVCGSVCTIVCSQIVTLLNSKFYKLSKMTNWLCRNTVLIIGTHYVFITFFDIVLSFFHLNTLKVYDIGLVFLVFFIISVYYPICKFTNKHLPFLSTTKEMRKNEGK